MDLVNHGDRSVTFIIEMDHLVGLRHDHVLVLRQLLQAGGGREFGLLQIQRAALIEQAAILGAQGFELIARRVSLH